MSQTDTDSICATCGGPLVTLGTLGTKTHYRCRNCGQQTSTGLSEEESKQVAADLAVALQELLHRHGRCP